MNKLKLIILLHLTLILLSFSGVFTKLASREEPLSLNFLFFYGIVLFILFIYALVWQQVIKRIPLTAAYANKAVITVWGMVWGNLFFNEEITLKKIIGVVIICCGILLYALSDNNGNKERLNE